MNCRAWRREIVEWLDGRSSHAEGDALFQHLASCPQCAAFHSEQLETDRVLQAARQVSLEPPPLLWQRIEVRIREMEQAPAAQPGFATLLDLFRLPQVSYGLGAALLLLLTGLVAIETRSPAILDQEVLARLEAFSVQADSNPFLGPMQEQNPFFTMEQSKQQNPFDLGGVAK
ncbi:MAG: zf-HC2 domain-containing protein [Acidobacteriota bacterium]